MIQTETIGWALGVSIVNSGFSPCVLMTGEFLPELTYSWRIAAEKAAIAPNNPYEIALSYISPQIRLPSDEIGMLAKAKINSQEGIA